MKYLIGMIGLGIVLLGAGEWQKTDWKKVGIVSDYDCERCTDGYSYQGWRFTQTAQLGIYHPVVSIPQTGSGYCDHQCLTASDDSSGETGYYDAIGGMRGYRNGENLVALWFYRHATGGRSYRRVITIVASKKTESFIKRGKSMQSPGRIGWMPTNRKSVPMRLKNQGL